MSTLILFFFAVAIRPSIAVNIDSTDVLGIAYDAFTPPGVTCKSESAIISNIKQLLNYGYKSVRLYGVDCGQSRLAIQAIEGTSKRVWLSIWSVPNWR